MTSQKDTRDVVECPETLLRLVYDVMTKLHASSLYMVFCV